MSILAGLGLLLVTVGCALMQEKSTRDEVWAADQNDDKIYVLDPEGKTLKTIGRDEKEYAETHGQCRSGRPGGILFLAEIIQQLQTLTKAKRRTREGTKFIIRLM